MAHTGTVKHAPCKARPSCALAHTASICPGAYQNVAMEGMSIVRPIGASRIGGLTDIILDGQSGLLVPPGDAQALQQAIQCLLDDPERRACMGVMARQRVGQFLAKSVVSRIEEVYREVLELC